VGELLLAGVVRTRLAAAELRIWNDDGRILTRAGTACPGRAHGPGRAFATARTRCRPASDQYN
jgi:hypothetical protein